MIPQTQVSDHALREPPSPGKLSQKQAVQIIQDRLAGRRAILVLDNLDTVQGKSDLLRFLRALTSRDIRILVTTRSVEGVRSLSYKSMVVKLQPINSLASCRNFLHWHVDHFASESPDFRRLDFENTSDARLQTLLQRTGGNPLLIQLVVSTAARASWAYMDELPHLFGAELLNFLYDERWQELEEAEEPGRVAQSILKLVARSQYQGQTVTFEVLATWSKEHRTTDALQPALRLLHDRFLIVNQDTLQGNFTIFPSLSEFLARKA